MFPQLHAAQNAWLSQIDSLHGARPQDARAHPPGGARSVLRNPAGVRRHAQLAREVGATWEEILGSIMLTVPGLGLLPAVAAIPHARRGFRRSARSRTGVTVPDVRSRRRRRFASCPSSPTTTATSGPAARAASCASGAARTAATTSTRRSRSARSCHSKNLAAEAVSGDATLATFSVNHQPWMPGPELPYIVAIVEIVEQPSVRLTTNLVNCAPDDVRDRHAGARHVRAPPRSRRRRLHPAVRARRERR